MEEVGDFLGEGREKGQRGTKTLLGVRDRFTILVVVMASWV